MTDIEIARNVKLKPIQKIAKKLGFKGKIELYGEYKAKLPLNYGKKKGKLILVSAMNPTKFGIGKTTVSIGLADAFSKLKKSVCLALREPSLGPVFGIKGGATGGGQSQVAPMEDINLHFNGDFHAITSANNLLSSLIDNHIFQGNELNIDENNIIFNRCLDLNDRALRQVVVGGGNKNGVERKDNFTITAASEIMSILCLSKDFNDLKNRLGNIAIAYNKKGKLLFAKDLKAQESMAILLKDAFKPNLVQTLNGTPAIIHGGPFANIAHGCNSIVATKLALSYSDYVITEAGFGADLGAEKFFDIKCRVSSLKPDAVVLIGAINAIKLHAGIEYDKLNEKNLEAIKIGIDNLFAHIDVIKNVYHLPLVVTLNKYESDNKEEIDYVIKLLKDKNINCVVNDAWLKGADGCINLANEVINKCNDKNSFTYCYDVNDTIKNKIKLIAKNVYGAKGVNYTEQALASIKKIKSLKMDNLPICIAKTQYSLSDNKKLLSRPTNFDITINDVKLKSGAGFIVAISGNMLLMPGLSKIPNAVNMKIDEDYTIEGLF